MNYHIKIKPEHFHMEEIQNKLLGGRTLTDKIPVLNDDISQWLRDHNVKVVCRNCVITPDNEIAVLFKMIWG